MEKTTNMRVTKRYAGLCAAALLAVSSTAIAPAQAQTASNVIDSGGVNLRSLGDVTTTSDTAQVKYELSFAPVQSSNREETTNSVFIVVPENATDVQFELVGTRLEERPNGRFAYEYKLPAPMTMDIIDSPEQASGISTRYQENGGFKGGVPTREQLKALTNDGYSTIPAGVLKSSEYEPNHTEGGQTYQIATEAWDPVAVNVTYSLPVEEETTYAPIRAFQAERCNYSPGAGTSIFAQGCSNILSERGVSSTNFDEWNAIFTQPINGNNVSENGLEGTYWCQPTKDTGDWATIGDDTRNAGYFSYSEEFRLTGNPDITYVAPSNEDQCDQVAATITKETEPTPEPGDDEAKCEPLTIKEVKEGTDETGRTYREIIFTDPDCDPIKIFDGVDGKDGEDGKSLTVVNIIDLDNASQRSEFSDGSTVIIPGSKPGDSTDVQGGSSDINIGNGNTFTSSGSSSSLGQCLANPAVAAGIIAIPALIVAPTIAQQINLPIAGEIRKQTNELQKGLGIHNDELARLAAQFRIDPAAARALGTSAAGLAVLGFLFAPGVCGDNSIAGALSSQA